VYCAVWPIVTDVGPLIVNPVSVRDGDGGGGGGGAEVIETLTLTVALWPEPLTTNDAEYGVEAAASSCVAKLTVTVPVFVPLFGDTLSQGALGVEIDHFNARVPPLVIVMVWGGIELPAVPDAVSVVGETDSTGCAYVVNGHSCGAMDKTHNRTATERMVIGGSRVV
jgi:hypothetical protein